MTENREDMNRKQEIDKLTDSRMSLPFIDEVTVIYVKCSDKCRILSTS